MVLIFPYIREEYSGTHLHKPNTSQDSLKRQAVIELVKRNVLASSMEMTVAYRWAFFPNKPIYNVDKNRMGVISAFTYTFQVNEPVSVSMDVRYIRKKLEDNILMFYLGGTHSASAILKEQSQNVKTVDKATVQKQMCDITRKLKEESYIRLYR